MAGQASVNRRNTRGRSRSFMEDSSESTSDWDVPARLTVSEILSKISTEQIPKVDHTRKCQEIALKVIGVLEKELGTRYAGHVMVSGSFGKGTAIVNDSDYDIVVYFKDVEPPFNTILAKMETAIRGNATNLPDFKWKFRSNIHICFDVQGMKFDITPASQFDNQFPWNRWCCFAPSAMTTCPTLQHMMALRKIKELADPQKFSYLYSSSLAVDAVLFVQRQHKFIHAVIRLAKFWAKHVNTKRIPIRGKSLLVETIAIHACYGLGPIKMTDENLDKAFLKFLELVADGNQLRLYVFVNYRRENIPDEVFNQTPLVLDPVNPYNNLLNPSNFSPLAVKCFQEAAQATIKNIRHWACTECETEVNLRNILAMRHPPDTSNPMKDVIPNKVAVK